MPATIILVLCVLFLLFIIRNCFKYPAKSRSARRLRFLLIAGTLGVFLICAVLEYGPRGKNSVFDQAGEGENLGSDSQQTYPGSPGQSMENIYITVSKSTVEIGGRSFEKESGYAGCEEFLQTRLNGGGQVIVRDNYAASAAYHYVTELLEKKGVAYLEETIE